MSTFMERALNGAALDADNRLRALSAQQRLNQAAGNAALPHAVEVQHAVSIDGAAIDEGVGNHLGDSGPAPGQPGFATEEYLLEPK